MEFATLSSTIIAGCGASSEEESPTNSLGNSQAQTPTGSKTPSLTPEQAQFSIRDIAVQPNPVRQTGNLTIEFEVANIGGDSGEIGIPIFIDGRKIEKLEVSLNASETTVKELAFQPNFIGSREIQVGGPSADSQRATVEVFKYPERFVQRNGRHFVDNGETLYVNGTNAKKLLGASEEYIDDLLSDAASMGLSTIRMRGFGEVRCKYFGGDGETGNPDIDTCDQDRYVLQQAPGEYDETTFRKLDYIVHEARKHDIRLIPFLCNNWGQPDQSGSMNWYVANASTASHHDDFYSNSEARKLFKEHIHTVLTRENVFNGIEYRNDPAIFMWELTNEAKLFESNEAPEETGRIVGEWYEEMAREIKSIDTNHLVSTGSVGVYAPNNEGRDFLGHHRIEAIDACSVHIYPTDEASKEDSAETLPCHPLVPDKDTCKGVLDAQADDAHSMLEKPIYVGEFGVNTYHWESVEEGQQLVLNVFEELYDIFKEADIDGAMFHELFSDDYFTGQDHIQASEVTAYTDSYRDGALRDIIEKYSDYVSQKG